VGGLDALASARLGGLSSVSYIGRKPVDAWRGTRAEKSVELDKVREATVIFEGSAREAALQFPQNANVAAAIALSGVGFDATRVRLIADPQARGNEHLIEAEGAFGRLTFSVVGTPMPGNPKTSSLAAYSLLRALVSPIEAITI
jgi:aspartate dehydrogenase